MRGNSVERVWDLEYFIGRAFWLGLQWLREQSQQWTNGISWNQKLLCSKRCFQPTEETAYRTGESLYQLSTWWRLAAKNIQRMQETKHQGDKWPHQTNDTNMGYGPEHSVLKRRIYENGYKTSLTCLISLATRKMQIKTALKFHLSPTTIAVIKKSN